MKMIFKCWLSCVLMMILCILLQDGMAQNPQYSWLHRFETPLQNNEYAANQVVSDREGNCIVIGDVGGDNITAFSLDPAGNPANDLVPADVFLSGGGLVVIVVAKYDSAGNHLWSFTLGDQTVSRRPYIHPGANIDVDDDNNVYITGSFQGTVDFDPGPAIFNLSTPTPPGAYNGRPNIFVSKYDSNGNFLWAHSIEAREENNFASDIVVDCENEALYICGTVHGGQVDLNPSLLGVNQINASMKRFFLGKYDLNGNYQWAFPIGEINTGQGWPAMTIDNQGDLLFAGDFTYPVDVDPSAGVAIAENPNVATFGTQNHTTLAKYNPNGDLIWHRQIYGEMDDSSHFMVSHCIALQTDKDNNVYLGGYLDAYRVRDIYFDPANNAGYHLMNANANTEMYLAKYNSNGDYLWSEVSVTTTLNPNILVTNILQDLHLDNEQHILLSGIVGSTNSNAATINFGGTQFTGSSHGFFGRLDGNGNMLQVGEFQQFSEVFGINHSRYHDIFVCGEMTNSQTAPFGGTLTTGSNLPSFFIAKYADPFIDFGDTIQICPGDSVLVHGKYQKQAGTYLDTFALGCNKPDSFSLIVVEVPDLQALRDTTVLCLGNSILLDAQNAGFQHIWSTGDSTQQILVQQGGNYVVTISDPESQCSVLGHFQLNERPKPIVNLGPEMVQFCNGNPYQLDAGNPGSTYLWSNSSEERYLDLFESGSSSVTVTNVFGCSSSDSVDAIVWPNPMVELGYDQEICDGEILVLNAENPGLQHSWSTGEETQTINVEQAGQYAVTVEDSNGCRGRDHIQVDLLPTPVFELGPDQTICDGEQVELVAQQLQQTKVTWSTGSSASYLHVTEPGLYWAKQQLHLCSFTDSVFVDFLPSPERVLPQNMLLCDPANRTLNLDAGNPGASYLWSTGDTNQILSISFQGNYSVTITAPSGCTLEDWSSVSVCAWGLYIPNAFTPNADGRNDLFKIYGESIEDAKLTIFDRWGAVITTQNGQSVAWDGTNRGGSPVQEGVYNWRLELTQLNNTGAAEKTVRYGRVTLIRNIEP